MYNEADTLYIIFYECFINRILLENAYILTSFNDMWLAVGSSEGELTPFVSLYLKYYQL